MNTNQPTYDDILRLFQETNMLMKELFVSQKETDRKFQETRQEIKAVNQAVNESIGKLGNRLGDYVEEMVRPAAVRLFREQGIDVHEVHRGVEASRNGDHIEIDLLVVNSTDVVAVECKSMLSIDDVDHYLVTLDKLKKMLPTYAEKRVIGAVAAMVLQDNVARYAYRKGLFVISESGNHLVIRNDAKFKPKVW